MKSKGIIVLLCAMLILTLAACEEKVVPTPEPTDVIATVNGVEIVYADFAEKYQETLDYYRASVEGDVLQDEEVYLKNSVLDFLIDNEVLIQAANSDDYEPDEDAVSAAYDDLVASYEDEAAYQAALEDNNTTAEEVRESLKTQDNIDYYLNTYATDHDMLKDLVVTEKEIEDRFLQYVVDTNRQDLTLDDLHDYLANMIQDEKMRAVVSEIVDILSADADIEKLITFK